MNPWLVILFAAFAASWLGLVALIAFMPSGPGRILAAAVLMGISAVSGLGDILIIMDNLANAVSAVIKL
jgi:hypothetical protein